jgi:hypothetical protein
MFGFAFMSTRLWSVVSTSDLRVYYWRRTVRWKRRPEHCSFSSKSRYGRHHRKTMYAFLQRLLRTYVCAFHLSRACRTERSVSSQHRQQARTLNSASFCYKNHPKKRHKRQGKMNKQAPKQASFLLKIRTTKHTEKSISWPFQSVAWRA